MFNLFYSLMLKYSKHFFLCILCFFAFFSSPVFAHPGNTDGNGCHTCRTNCTEKWGIPYGFYHRHNPVRPCFDESPTPTQYSLSTSTIIATPTRIPTKWPTATPRPTKRPTMTPTKAPTSTSIPISSPSATLTPTATNTSTVAPTSKSEVKGEQVKVSKRTFWERLKMLFGWGKK